MAKRKRRYLFPDYAKVLVSELIRLRWVPIGYFYFGRFIDPDSDLSQSESVSGNPVTYPLAINTLSPDVQKRGEESEQAKPYDEWLIEEINKAYRPTSLVLESPSHNLGAALQHSNFAIGELKVHGDADLKLFDKKIDRLIASGNVSVRLTKCSVTHLVLSGGIQTLNLTDTWVGALELKDNGPKYTSIRGGGILSFRCDPRSKDPVRGEVRLSNVYIPRFNPDAERLDVQPLRTMRAALVSLHNARAAGIFHAVELSLSRKTDPILPRFIGYLYEMGCDYGNSLGRAVIWFFTFWAVATFVGFDCGNIRLGDPNSVGWIKNTSEVVKAVVYPISSALNPLSIFNSRPLLVVDSPKVAGVLAALSIGMLIAAAMFFISLRRRFRLE